MAAIQGIAATICGHADTGTDGEGQAKGPAR